MRRAFDSGQVIARIFINKLRHPAEELAPEQHSSESERAVLRHEASMAIFTSNPAIKENKAACFTP